MGKDCSPDKTRFLRLIRGAGPKGLTLLEVLVSLLLLSLMLLGLDAINLSSLRTAKAIWYYQLAHLQTENMQEYLRAGHGSINVQQLTAWNRQNQALLPAGTGKIESQRITIFWGNNNQQVCVHSIIAPDGCLTASLSSSY